jgi:hypothetical protein
MNIRVLGGGIYGSHIALALIRAGHDVELHEIKDRLFSGASGNSPARGHRGFHYPRSATTRAACLGHVAEFEKVYGHLTHGVPCNVYAIADVESLVDFGTYTKILSGDVQFVTVEQPWELGLRSVEGAVLTGERHLVIDTARNWFTKELQGRVVFNSMPFQVDDARWDWTIDCTFCANDSQNIDRFEACLTVLLEGPADKAVTIMDGPFPGLYPWNEAENLCSLSSARHTPMARYTNWLQARAFLDGLSSQELDHHTELMIDQMAWFYPAVKEYRIAGHLLAVRAMPRSASDARLIDVVRVGERALRVRAGKIDAIFAAEAKIKEMIAA